MMLFVNQKSKKTKKQKAKEKELLSIQRKARRELQRFIPLTSTPKVPEYRSTAHIPSVTTTGGTVEVKERMMYTGDKLIGISMLHKSNLVPVFSQDDAIDIAKMRR